MEIPFRWRDIVVFHLGHLRPCGFQFCHRRGDFRDDLAFANHAALQIVRRIRCENFSTQHDHHTAARHLHFRQNVRRDQHRVRARQTFDERTHETYLVRIKPDGRFVEDDQIRLVNDGIRQPDTLFVAFGKLTDDALAHIRETALLENRINAVPRASATQAFQPRAKLEVFADAHLVVQRIIFRHVTDATTHFLGIVKHIVARHARRAGGRRHETRKDAHGGAFSRAVRPQQTDDLSARHRKRDARQRRVTGVAFRQIADINHRGGTHQCDFQSR